MRFIAAFVLCLVIIVGGSWLFVWSGVYDIGADAPHWPITVQIIDALRDHSIAQRDGDVAVPDLDDQKLIAVGADHYAAMCTGCHLAPGKGDSDIRQGLYPQPPDFSKRGIGNPAEAFWAIKHGIKMSAMPAWGVTHDDRKIWALVAFLRRLPHMDVVQYRQLTEPGGDESGSAPIQEKGDEPGAMPPAGPPPPDGAAVH